MEVILVFLFIIWIVPSLIAGAIADSKGRSFASYFLVSFFFTPIIGIIAALLINPDPKHVANETLRTGEGKKCPYCAEIIKYEAKVCRYCGRELPADKNTDAWAIYLSYGEQQSGPFTVKEIIEMRKREAIPEDAWCWRDGLADWQPLSEMFAPLEIETPDEIHPSTFIHPFF
jgi:hypothetical protein